MHREDKIFVGLMVVFIAISITLIAFQSIPFETEKEIWLPEYYSITNRIDGRYIPKDELPAIWSEEISFSFEQYRELYEVYEGLLARENYTVTVLKEGEVYYSWTSGGRHFVTKKDYGIASFHGILVAFQKFLRTEEVIDMPTDETIRFYYARDWVAVGVFGAVGFLASMFLSVLFTKPIELIVTKLKPLDPKTSPAKS